MIENYLLEELVTVAANTPRPLIVLSSLKDSNIKIIDN